jgi:ketosteroid isomerase-like protein
VALAPAEPSVPWLQPAPDAALGLDDPATVVAARTGVRLAFIAALQLLPARQRAVLALRDVLAFRTAEVAEMLGTSTAAVDSALRRGRPGRRRAGRAGRAAPPGPARRLRRRVHRADPAALVDLLRADVELEMPPIPTWFTGRAAVVGFLGARVLRRPGQWRMVPAAANGQPALVAHERAADGRYRAHGVAVLTLLGDRISRITAFNDPALVPAFGTAPALTP